MYYKKKDNFGNAIHFSTSMGKMEGCESCTLSHSMDGHRSYVSIFLRHRIILDMQFPNQPIGVKLKVV